MPEPAATSIPNRAPAQQRSLLDAFEVRVRRSGVLALGFVLAGSVASAGLAAVANWMTANALGPSGFALFSLAMAIMTVLQEMGGPALDTAIVRFAAPLVARDPARAEAFYRAGLRLKILVSGALGVALLVAAQPLAESVFGQPELASLIRWMALCLLAANLSTIMLARLQSAERFVTHALLRTLSNVLKVALLGAILLAGWLTPQVATMVWTFSLVLTYLAGAAICRGFRVEARSEPGDRPYRDIAGFAGWAMLSGLMFAVHIRAALLLLGYMGTPDEVGNYAVAANLMLLIDLITSSLVVALMPKVAKATTQAEVAAIRKSAVLTGVGVAVALLPLYIFAEPLMRTLFPGFPNAVAPFELLFWSSIVALLVYPLYLGFYVQNKPAKVSLAYGLLAISSVAAALILIPRYGLIGAAMSTLLARLIGAVAILVLLALERPMLPPAKADV